MIDILIKSENLDIETDKHKWKWCEETHGEDMVFYKEKIVFYKLGRGLKQIFLFLRTNKNKNK